MNTSGKDRFLYGLAASSFIFVLARAAIQSITIDEADTVLVWVLRTDPSHWQAGANNHVLNSVLIRLFVTVFGLHHLTTRGPTLLGALLYISACVLLCRWIIDGQRGRCTLFAALTLNPFVLDYLVAARGYGLAVGFLMWALLILASIHFGDPKDTQGVSIETKVAACSAFAGLSFISNFSFAVVSAAILGIVVVRSFRLRRSFLGFSVAVTAPAGGGVALLCLPHLFDRHGIELVHGATSLREAVASIANSLMFEPNPFVANPLLYPLLTYSQPILPPLVAATCLAYLVLRVAVAKYGHDSAKLTPRTTWSVLLLGILSGTIAAHWLMNRAWGILLPMDRTALFFAPLLILACGSLLADPVERRLFKYVRLAALGSSLATTVFFLGCLRLTYFREWKFGADVESIYRVLAEYHDTHKVRAVAANWRYTSSLNYYLAKSGKESFREFAWRPHYPGEHDAYVLYFLEDEEFIQKNGLKIVYYSRLSDAVVAVAPHVAGPD